MANTYITEKDIKEFRQRFDATYDLCEKNKIKLTTKGYIGAFNPFDVIMMISIEHLYKSTKTLNVLTSVLIVLTIILVIVSIALLT